MKYIFSIVFLFFILQIHAQKYFTRSGDITFFSKTPIENIEAVNKKGTCVLDTETGNIEWAVLIKAFQFEKALMQEHFNENYMESSVYPKSVFKGQLQDFSSVDLSKDGMYDLNAIGNLTIHGVTNDVVAPVKLTVKNGMIKGEAVFKIAVADYDIDVPAVVRDNVAKIVQINVNAELKELN
jgi:hypothetical protein